METPYIGEVINTTSPSQDHHVEPTPSSSWLGRKWTNLSSYVTKDNIAGLYLTGSALLGGYVSATAYSIPEVMDGVMIATATASLVCFFWGMSCAIMDKQYSKAAKILVASGALGALSYGASEVRRIESERRFQKQQEHFDAFWPKEPPRPERSYPIKQQQAEIDVLSYDTSEVSRTHSKRCFQEKVDSLGWSEKLSTKPPRPERSYPIKQQQAENWINAHPCAFQREAARKLVSATEHISQQKFETALQDSVHQFNQWLSGKDYIIITTKTTQKRSNSWVAELALEHLETLPKEVKAYYPVMADTYTSLKQVIDYRLDHPDLKVIALFDDGAYSGSQIAITVKGLTELSARTYCEKSVDVFYNPVIPVSCTSEKIERFEATHEDVTIALIIPFMRTPEFVIPPTSNSDKRSPIRIFTSKRFPVVSDALTEQEWKSLGITHPWKVTAYFDHKMADYASVPNNAYEGQIYKSKNGCSEATNLLKDGEYHHSDVDTRFIEEIKPPYK